MLLKKPNCDPEKLRQFAIRLFDPKLSGVISGNEFENIVRKIFATEIEKPNQTIKFETSAPEQDNIADNYLEKLRNEGVYEVNGFLNTDKLNVAFCKGIFDIETLMQGLK